jgi:hypothetical protein
LLDPFTTNILAVTNLGSRNFVDLVKDDNTSLRLIDVIVRSGQKSVNTGLGILSDVASLCERRTIRDTERD